MIAVARSSGIAVTGAAVSMVTAVCAIELVRGRCSVEGWLAAFFLHAADMLFGAGLVVDSMRVVTAATVVALGSIIAVVIIVMAVTVASVVVALSALIRVAAAVAIVTVAVLMAAVSVIARAAVVVVAIAIMLFLVLMRKHGGTEGCSTEKDGEFCTSLWVAMTIHSTRTEQAREQAEREEITS